MSFALFSCKKEDGSACLVSRGNEASEIRKLNSFHELDVYGRLEVVLVQDTANWLEITFSENIINSISSNLESGVLTLSENISCEWLRKQRPIPKIEVHFLELSQLRSQCAGTILCQNQIVSDTFLLEINDAAGSIELNGIFDKIKIASHTGATDILVSGSSRYIEIYNASYGPLDASNLIAETAEVASDATGHTYVYASEVLYYQILDIGNIYLSGTRNAEAWNKSGSGKLFYE